MGRRKKEPRAVHRENIASAAQIYMINMYILKTKRRSLVCWS